ncbi:MAG: hypothetical protein ACQEQN_09915 [Thermodesulfobacteriota bacterium]
MRIIGKILTRLKTSVFAAVFVVITGTIIFSGSFNPAFAANNNPAETVGTGPLTGQSQHDGYDEHDDGKNDDGSCH